MEIIADFHIHSYLSRATSKNMNIEELSMNGRMKGLGLLGTGDFTHPVWLNHLKEKLAGCETEPGSGVFDFKGMNWMLTGEVATIYYEDNRSRKVHHVIHAPSFEVVEQINEALVKHGSLKADGRPILSLPSPDLVETMMAISKDILVYPAHAWTSWFGVIGEYSGFNSIEDCYHDQTKYVHALETGMSSDPAMNWRVSSLDKFTLLSNSDSHSPWVWRIGREANAFEIPDEKLSYREINDAIVNKDPKRLKFTIEVDPSYGKYHFTGHRAHGISLSPSGAKRLNNICPVCGKKLTIGVLQRVEELADRPEEFVLKGAIPFKSLLPLYEIISFATGTNQLYSKSVVEVQNLLIDKFGSEFEILLNTSHEELAKIVDRKIADAIIRIRNGDVKYIPGYDGVYGRPVFSEDEYERLKEKQVAKNNEQRSLIDFKK